LLKKTNQKRIPNPDPADLRGYRAVIGSANCMKTAGIAARGEYWSAERNEA